jgi:hypothetical protein
MKKFLVAAICASCVGIGMANAAVVSYTFSGEVSGAASVTDPALNFLSGQTLTVNWVANTDGNEVGGFQTFSWLATVGGFSQSNSVPDGAGSGFRISFQPGNPGSPPAFVPVPSALQFFDEAQASTIPAEFSNLRSGNVEVLLNDLDGVAFSSLPFDELPTTFALSLFEIARLSFGLFIQQPNGSFEFVRATAPITSFSVQQVSEVPVPAAFPLFLAGMGGLTALRNRRRRNRSKE